MLNGLDELLEPERQKDTEYAARIIRSLARRICTVHPELSCIFDLFELTPEYSEIAISTDGRRLYYNPKHIVRQFSSNNIASVAKQLMHVVMHYLRGDIFSYGESAHKDVMDIYMDAEVSRCLVILGFKDPESIPHDADFGYYRNKYDKKYAQKIREKYRDISSDEHTFWLNVNNAAKDGSSMNAKPGAGDKEREEWQLRVRLVFGKEISNPADLIGQFEDLIGNLKKSARIESGQDIGLGVVFEAQWEPVKSITDYRKLIPMVLDREIKEDESEEIIDRMMYCYGLEMNEDVPYIEPGEDECAKKDVGRIAIAIDTSGSCFNYIAMNFLGEMRRILDELYGGVSSEPQIIVYECDYEIRCEEHFKGDDVFRALSGQRLLHGGGGTSFVPVFERIDRINEEDGDHPVRALIYLSDCYGTFPEKKPDYPVIFVLPEYESQCRIEVPDYVNLCYFKADRKSAGKDV